MGIAEWDNFCFVDSHFSSFVTWWCSIAASFIYKTKKERKKNWTTHICNKKNLLKFHDTWNIELVVILHSKTYNNIVNFYWSFDVKERTEGFRV